MKNNSENLEKGNIYKPIYYENWEDKILYDLAIWKNGLAFKNINFTDNGKPVIKIAELKNGITAQTKFTQDIFDDSVHLTKGDMLFSWSGNPETSIDAFYYNLPDGWLNQHIFKITTKSDVFYKYFFYILKYLKPNFQAIATNKQTTGLGHVTINDLKKIKIKLPPLEEQKKIASILSSLDDKIEINNRMNKILEETAQTIFKEWFINFNFPNAKGKPYKDSGGKMIRSELGEIPYNFKLGILDEIIELFDNKRIPLSNMEREKKEKIYPYYGAASLMDYVDDYIFDGTYILLGEDGTVIDSKGYPILQYVYGKFWVNNHAHVIKAKSGFNEESLFVLLKNINVKRIVTGAVQPKINQNNLKSLKIIIPDKKLIENYNKISKSIFDIIKSNQIENQKLASIRDSILPKLMSGEIRIK